MSKSERTRQHLLDTTQALLQEGDRASMQAIADAAGVTRQLLYVHFDGRADLLLELSRQVDRRVRTPQRQAMVDLAPTGREALQQAVALQGWIKPRIDPVASAIDRLRHEDQDAAIAWTEREVARHRRCLKVARRLAAEGVLADDWSATSAARMIWSCTSHRAWQELVQGAGWSTAAWVRETTTLLERSLMRAKGLEHS